MRSKPCFSEFHSIVTKQHYFTSSFLSLTASTQVSGKQGRNSPDLSPIGMVAPSVNTVILTPVSVAAPAFTTPTLHPTSVASVTASMSYAAPFPVTGLVPPTDFDSASGSASESDSNSAAGWKPAPVTIGNRPETEENHDQPSEITETESEVASELGSDSECPQPLNQSETISNNIANLPSGTKFTVLFDCVCTVPTKISLSLKGIMKSQVWTSIKPEINSSTKRPADERYKYRVNMFISQKYR